MTDRPKRKIVRRYRQQKYEGLLRRALDRYTPGFGTVPTAGMQQKSTTNDEHRQADRDDRQEGAP